MGVHEGFCYQLVKLSKEVHAVHEQLEMMGELAWAYWSLVIA